LILIIRSTKKNYLYYYYLVSLLLQMVEFLGDSCLPLLQSEFLLVMLGLLLWDFLGGLDEGWILLDLLVGSLVQVLE